MEYFCRDRCQERREGKGPDDNTDLAKTAQYKAVAPTADQVGQLCDAQKFLSTMFSNIFKEKYAW